MIFVAITYVIFKAIQWTLIAIAALIVATFLVVFGMLALVVAGIATITDKTADLRKDN